MAASTNILFLDIDGVLCTHRSHHVFNRKSGSSMRALDPVGIRFINNLCRTYKLSIVVSSTWRKTPAVTFPYTERNGNPPSLMGYLRHCGIKANFHDDWKTPSLPTGFRGDEIEDWMQRNGKPPAFIILDDDSDFHGYQKPHHVRTDAREGINYANMLEADKILKGASLKPPTPTMT